MSTEIKNKDSKFKIYTRKEIQKVYSQHHRKCGTVLYSKDGGYVWQSVGMDSGKWDINEWLFAFIDEYEKSEKPQLKVITGCRACPMCDMNDMGPGYSCNLKKFPNNQILEDKKFRILTPDWCPLKEQAFMFKFKKELPPDKVIPCKYNEPECMWRNSMTCKDCVDKSEFEWDTQFR